MSILTAGELAQMRADAAMLMPDMVTITDPGTIIHTAGGGTDISGSSSSTVAGRLSRTGTQATRAEFGEQLTAEADYVLTVPHGTTIREGWSVTVGGITYTVTAVAKPGSWGAAVRALALESTAVGG